MAYIQYWRNICRWYGEFNPDRSSHQDEFCEGRPKSVVAPETIEHEHLTAKEIYSRWIPHNLSIAQKKPCIDWHFWALKISIWRVFHVLTWHRMTSLYSRTLKIKWEVNVFRHLKKRLMRSECVFWRYLNQSGKSASTIGSNACKGA